MMTSGDNTGRTLYVHILNNAEGHCTAIKSMVMMTVGDMVPSDSIGGNTISGTVVIHAGGRVHHPSNSCVHFSSGTYMLLGTNNSVHKDHVFNPITERLHTAGVGVISLTPRILWFYGAWDGRRVACRGEQCDFYWYQQEREWSESYFEDSYGERPYRYEECWCNVGTCRTWYGRSSEEC